MKQNICLFSLAIIFLAAALFLTACGSGESDDGRPYVVTTTMMLEDIVNQVASDFVRVDGLMGPGVDPHVYRATPGDFRALERAELILYNGHYLEARLSEILATMPERTFAAAEQIDTDLLIEAYEFGGNYDPHVWFDVSLWIQVVEAVGSRLQDLVPDHAEEIASNTADYILELESLDEWVRERLNQVPEQRRVLITAHDAFSYFGKAYGFEVMGLQGLSTQSEYGLQDVSRMVRFIIENEIPAIFLETSIAPRSVQSLMNGVRERGGHVELGGELFSDAMGARGSEEGTYIGMVRFNINTIAGALE